MAFFGPEFRLWNWTGKKVEFFRQYKLAILVTNSIVSNKL